MMIVSPSHRFMKRRGAVHSRVILSVVLVMLAAAVLVVGGLGWKLPTPCMLRQRVRPSR